MKAKEDVGPFIGGIFEEATEPVVDLPQWGTDEFLLGPFAVMWRYSGGIEVV